MDIDVGDAGSPWVIAGLLCGGALVGAVPSGTELPRPVVAGVIAHQLLALAGSLLPIPGWPDPYDACWGDPPPLLAARRGCAGTRRPAAPGKGRILPGKSGRATTSLGRVFPSAPATAARAPCRPAAAR
eukprot:gene44500-3095_t